MLPILMVHVRAIHGVVAGVIRGDHAVDGILIAIDVSALILSELILRGQSLGAGIGRGIIIRLIRDRGIGIAIHRVLVTRNNAALVLRQFILRRQALIIGGVIGV